MVLYITGTLKIQKYLECLEGPVLNIIHTIDDIPNNYDKLKFS